MEDPSRTPDFSFVHAADLHLDTPFKGIGSTAPHVADQLREASLGAFDSLVDLCLDRHAAFLVIAGDIYDGPERGLRAQLRFRDGLARLSRAGIASFVVHGNHDPVETGWSALNGPWPERVTVFGCKDVQAVSVEVDGRALATVQGISFAHRSERENLALRFAPKAGPGLQVGVLHCNVQGAASGYDDYSPCTLEELRSIGLDYWALGHVHTRLTLSGRKGSDEPWVVYSGNIQARSPKPSERGSKGATLVHVSDGHVQDIEPVACDVVRFDLVELDIAEIADLAELRTRLVSAARERLGGADGRALVLRGHLVGQGELHSDLRRPGATEDLRSALREDFEEDRPFCWWDCIDDRSRPAIDLEVARAGSDFAADLISLADALALSLANDDAALDGFATELSEGLPGPLKTRRAIERLLKSSGLPPAELIDRALVLALGELEGDRR
ncbi:MAG: DNA repair exonuclease [Acidimicrobiales bacterium]|jgi:DNA repair exonuclease SbcCD nuclease subunit